MPNPIKRTVFFVSDGTGLTVEALGHSLMTQFEDIEFKQIRIPFLDNVEKAQEAVARINAQGEADGMRPIVFTTLVNTDLAGIVHQADAFCLSYFDTFLAPLEAELGFKSNHTVGRSHGSADSSDYKNRIEAINYTLAHDDGITDRDLAEADVILVAVSRCGKTPTSLYLAMQFGLKAANFPLIPEDFDRPPARHAGKAPQQAVRPDHPARAPAPDSRGTQGWQQVRLAAQLPLRDCRSRKDDAPRRHSLARFLEQVDRGNLDHHPAGTQAALIDGRDGTNNNGTD